jgi:hypothetical protein
MTLQDIAAEMLKDIDRYAAVKEVEVPKLVQARTHKKKRINKKWKKRYGMKVIYEKTKARVADITMDNVIEFCHEKGLALPDELLTKQNN